jgi:hypothetical protein
MTRSGWVVVVTLALVAGSCSGGASDASTTSTLPTSTTVTTRPGSALERPTAVEFAHAAVDLFDGEGVDAALAILVALDRGYSLAQVVEAVFDGSLAADGIVMRGGSIVDPDGEPAGLILGFGDHAAFAFGEILGWTFQEIREEIESIIERQEIADAHARATAERAAVEEDAREATTILVIATLAEMGYSAEQIVFAVVFDEWQCDPEQWALEVLLAYGRSDPTSHRCGIPGEDPAFERQGVLDVGDGSDPGAPDEGTTGGGGETGPTLVAFGAMELPDQDGQIVRNEFRFEACADGRFFAEGVVEVIGDVNSLYTMEGAGTWDPAAGTGSAEVTEFISFVSDAYGESSNEVSGPAAVTVGAASITVISTEQSLTFPIVASEPARLCSGE